MALETPSPVEMLAYLQKRGASSAAAPTGNAALDEAAKQQQDAVPQPYDATPSPVRGVAAPAPSQDAAAAPASGALPPELMKWLVAGKQPSVAQAPPAPKPDTQLQAAQAQAQDNFTTSQMARGAALISKGFGGTGDTGYAEALEKNAQAPVQNLLQQRAEGDMQLKREAEAKQVSLAARMKDATSEESKQARAFFKSLPGAAQIAERMGPDFENVSAAQLNIKGGDMASIMDAAMKAQTAAAARQEEVERQRGRDASLEKHQQAMEELTRLGLNKDNFTPEKGADGSILLVNHRTGETKQVVGPTAKLAAPGTAGTGGGLTAGALDSQAEYYNATGKIQGVGQGAAGAAMRRAIINRANELHPEGNIAGNQAGYHADSASLTKAQQQADSVEQFENTALKNLNTALAAAKDAGLTGSPLFNRPWNAFKETVLGDPKISKAKAGLITARAEISKVLSGSLGSGAVSDGARHEVEGMLGPDASLAQLYSAADILTKDMANRKEAVRSQIADIRGRMGGKGTPANAGGEGGGNSKPQTMNLKGVIYDVQPDGTYLPRK